MEQSAARGDRWRNVTCHVCAEPPVLEVTWKFRRDEGATWKEVISGDTLRLQVLATFSQTRPNIPDQHTLFKQAEHRRRETSVLCVRTCACVQGASGWVYLQVDNAFWVI